MEERKQLYKYFENKKVRLITNSNFVYHTNSLKVFENSVEFIDNRGNHILLSISEIKFIEEISHGK